LLRRLTRAELAAADGRTGAALAELRAGLAAVHARRGQLGSLDLQTGTAALGAELAGAGLRLVLASGSPRQVFAWLERSRAQSFLVRPVRPPSDSEAAAVLAELRQLGFLIRTAELSGQQPDPAHVARRAELQRQVRQGSWHASGPGVRASGIAGVVADAADVAATLAASGHVLMSLAVHGGRMLAVTIAGGRFRLTPLGDFAVVAEATRRLTADLDALAGRRLPARLRPAPGPCDTPCDNPRDNPSGNPRDEASAGLVVIPVGVLSAVPWGMLPGLRGRPVTVCPSASAWLASWRAAQGFAPRPRPGPGVTPLLVAGPGLRHAEPEVTEVAAAYPGSRPLVGPAATVDATLRALDGAPLAHLAAHGHHDRQNVLFSRLDLADGPLMAYDVQRLTAPPRQVVLSACDVGRAVVRPGDEGLGFAAALLHIGTPTVISSVSRVADEVAFGVMTAYHRALSTGTGPALALALAAADEPLTPFVCFGAG